MVPRPCPTIGCADCAIDSAPPLLGLGRMQTPMTTNGSGIGLHNCPGSTPSVPTSKNQAKKQKKYEEHMKQRKLRRAKERERRKEKRRQNRAEGLPANEGPSRKELKRRQAINANDAQALSVAIDLDYDDLMLARDISKCVKQCLRMYTINRRAESPGHLHFTGIKRNGHIHEAFQKNDGWENWHVQYSFDRSYMDVFDKAKLVYLTCESENVLDKLRPGFTYVIGGLVDHNHFKGLCHSRATAAGIATARLPLNEHVDMKTRSVLSTFHVFELLTRAAAGQDWTTAILATIPLRKGAKPKLASTDAAIATTEAEQEASADNQLQTEIEAKTPATAPAINS